MSKLEKKSKLTVDGVDYDIDKLTTEAKRQIENIKFTDNQILQLQNELAISNAARVGYIRELEVETAFLEDIDD